MPAAKPIDTAPRDGRRVTVHWTDFDGQENQSIGRYRSLEQLRKAGGDWDEADAGWWVFIDGDTQKKCSRTPGRRGTTRKRNSRP